MRRLLITLITLIILITLTLSSLSFAQSTPTPTPTTPIITTTTIHPANVSVAALRVPNPNLRQTPNSDAIVLQVLTPNQTYPITSLQQTHDGFWYQIVTPSQQSGWLSSLTLNVRTVWQPQLMALDQLDLVLVPPGCFIMGSDQHESDESPPHVQCFHQPFWIDRYEVTNFAYGTIGAFSSPQQPRDSLSWFEAHAFCQQRGMRLPTEAEWEYAARSPENRLYPWGNLYDDEATVSSWQITTRRTSPVGSRPSGVSWVGAHDMAGNVWEWTSSLYAPYPFDPADGRESTDDTFSPRVVRGGACCSYIIPDVRSSYRFPVDPYTQDANIGFRCVMPVSSTSP